MRIILLVAAIALLLFSVAPVAAVVVDTFQGDEAFPSLQHYRDAFAGDRFLKVLLDSVMIATGGALFAVLLGVPYAFFIARVRTPLRGLFGGLYLLPLVLPPLLMAMGWTQFLRAAESRPAIPGPDSVLGGITGSAFLFGLAYFPFVTMFARKAFLDVGAGFEEAARVSTGPLRAFARVTLRLAWPSILAGALFAFLFAIADFSVVDYLSTVAPVKKSVRAYPFEAFTAWNNNINTADRRSAAALGLPLAALSLGLLAVIHGLVERGRVITVAAVHRRPAFVETGSRPAVQFALRAFGLLFLAATIVLSVGVPLGRLAYEASGGPGLSANVSETIFGAGNARLDLGRTVVFAAFAAGGMAVLATVLAHHAVRRGPRRLALVISASFLPLAFGPILFGAGLIRLWNQPFLQSEAGRNPVYDTGVLVVFMLIGKYLPFAIAAAATTMRRIDPGYEEAARIAGAQPGRRMLDVVVPLSMKGIVAGLVLGFVFSLRELDTNVLLTAGNRTVMMKIYTWVHVAHDAKVAALAIVITALIAVPFVLWSVFAARRGPAV